MEIKQYNFNIKRFDPDTGKDGTDTFRLSLHSSARVLDGLVMIKDTLDGSLTFRRSCAHGVCGSCAMMINGKNMLACQVLVKDLPQEIDVDPLPALPVIKDLVVDMEPFFEKNDVVMPYLINDEPPPERERLQSQEEQKLIQDSITCIMCSCCTNSCPSFWGDREYLGPSALLKAYRFIFDSRDRAEKDRLATVLGEHGLWRCHSIYNCVEACPKEIDITAHLLKLKRLAVRHGIIS